MSSSIGRRSCCRLGLGGRCRAAAARASKTIVEHTAINPNKAAHIGHLRNSALGDTLVACCASAARRSRCRTTSTTPACRWPTSSSASARSKGSTSPPSRRIADTTRFDYYCWDLYARVTEWYEGDKERLKIRAAALHDIEHGGNPTADMAASSPTASSAVT
jgi:arginyl-tRNA synthetase